VLNVQIWQQVRHLAALGWSRRAIARQLGLSRNTVARVLEQEQPPRSVRSHAPGTVLEPFAEATAAGLRRGLSGERLLEEVREGGYIGSRATFYRWLTHLKAAQRPPAAACRFETDPGEQAQFDWCQFDVPLGGEVVTVYFFGLVLAYCRRVHFFPSLSIKQAAVYEALEASFQHFGGVCRYLVVDNAKVFVQVHRSPMEWHPPFLEFCGHYAIQPIAGTPYHPQGKGKIEHPFGPLQTRFLQGRAWRDFDQLEAELADFERRWERRIHGTTKAVPLERFATERPALLPLPATPFLLHRQQSRQVSGDCLVSYGGVRYSVPWAYAGQRVLVRERQGRQVVVFSAGGVQIAVHALQARGTPPVLCAEHYEGLRRRHQAQLATLVARFREQYGSQGETAEAFLQRLFVQQTHHPRGALSQVLELLSGVPAPVALATLADAVEFNLCTPRFLEELLRRRLQSPARPPGGRAASAPPALGGQLPLPQLDVDRPLAAYGRALPAAEQTAARERSN
jgi:transposase